MMTAGITRMPIQAGIDSEPATPCRDWAWMTSWAAMNPTFSSSTHGNRNAVP